MLRGTDSYSPPPDDPRDPNDLVAPAVVEAFPSIGISPALPEQQRLGRSAYTGRLPSGYDLFVLGISNRWIWRCPTPRLLDHYRQHVTANHLEVAVGTGYLLERTTFPIANPRLALLDLNASSTANARRRLARYSPEVYEADVLQPVAGIRGRFDSIGLNYLLHCLPGPFAAKAVAFDNLIPLLAHGGVVFGATIVGGGTRRNLAARGLARLYNRAGIFDNDEDTPDELRAALDRRFDDWTVEVVGSAALFSARRRARVRPRPSRRRMDPALVERRGTA